MTPSSAYDPSHDHVMTSGDDPAPSKATRNIVIVVLILATLYSYNQWKQTKDAEEHEQQKQEAIRYQQDRIADQLVVLANQAGLTDVCADPKAWSYAALGQLAFDTRELSVPDAAVYAWGYTSASICNDPIEDYPFVDP